MFYFAHDGETHETVTESTLHATLETWYVALPLYVLILVAIGSAAYLVARSKTTVLNVLLGVLFIAGVALYSVSPAVSIASLACGFGLALAVVIIGLGKS